jgi:hypothetical protein
MEGIPSHLPESTQQFFRYLEEAVGAPLVFYGSVLRDDYFPFQSDVDAAWFVASPEHTLHVLQTLLAIPSSRVFEVVKQVASGPPVRGFKVSGRQWTDVRCELFVYSIADRARMMATFRAHQHVVWFMLPLWWVTKHLFYTWGLLPLAWYKWLKQAAFHLDFQLGPSVPLYRALPRTKGLKPARAGEQPHRLRPLRSP